MGTTVKNAPAHYQFTIVTLINYMQEALLSKRAGLRAVQTVGERVNLPLLCPDSESYRRLMDDTFLEEYYEEIGQWTFHSEFLSLTQEQAKALCVAHQHWNESKSNVNELVPELEKLSNEIQSASDRLRTSQFFVRLSTRSPKDAVIHHPSFRSSYQKSLDRFGTLKDSEFTDNAKLVALYEALTYTMACDSGNDAVRLLITSDRIQEDLRHYCEEGGKNLQVVIREWFSFEVQHEFRAFVYQGKLTAITQYNEMCYFPELVQHQEDIGRFMIETVQRDVLPAIQSLDSLVIDIILSRSDSGEWLLKIVEINPFAEFAGTGLFSWENDKLTLMGKRGFEFRIHQSPPTSAMTNLPSSMLTFLTIAENRN